MSKGKRWSEEDDNFLKQEHEKISIEELAIIFNRTQTAIKSRMKKLGIKKEKSFEGDSDTHKTCRSCFRVLPKTTEFFNKRRSTFHSYCRECHSVKSRETKILNKLRSELKEKEDFRLSISNKKYICKKCGNEKLGEEMKVNLKRKQVANCCKKCHAEQGRKSSLKAIEKMDFSLKQRSGEKK